MAQMGKIEEMRSYCKKPAALYPRETAPRMGTGRIYAEIGNYKDAEEASCSNMPRCFRTYVISEERESRLQRVT